MKKTEKGKKTETLKKTQKDKKTQKEKNTVIDKIQPNAIIDIINSNVNKKTAIYGNGDRYVGDLKSLYLVNHFSSSPYHHRKNLKPHHNSNTINQNHHLYLLQ